MTQVLEAVFDAGVFKPLEHVQLRDHERVTLIVSDNLTHENSDQELAQLLETPFDPGVRSPLNRKAIYDEESTTRRAGRKI